MHSQPEVPTARLFLARVIAALALSCSTALATPFVDLQMQTETLAVRAQISPNTGADVLAGNATAYHFLYKGSTRYDMPYTGKSSDPWFSTSPAFNNTGRSLGFTIPANTNTVKDRVELRVVHGVNDVHKLTFGGTYGTGYLGFAVYVDPSTNLSGSEVVHISQAWQKGAETVVPFTMSLYKDAAGAIRFKCEAKYSNTVAASTVQTGALTPGAWNRFVIRLTPQHTTNGTIQIWRNGNPLTTWTGRFGSPPGSLKGAVNGMDLRVGLYRGSLSTAQKIYFDNVRYGSSYADAAP